MSDAGQSSGRGPILGAGAVVLAVLCCLAAPAILGAVAGAAIGGILGIGAAIACAAAVAVAVAVVIRRRQGKEASGC